MHIFDSERNILNILWDKGDTTAREIAEILAETVGWNRNTTYTVIKKCVTKGLVERIDPHFFCHALVSRETAQAEAVHSLLDGWFGGSTELLVCSLLDRKELSAKDLDELKKRLAEPERED